MAQEGIAWIMRDRHRTSDSLPEETENGAALGHQRYVRPLSIWHTVGTDTVGLTGRDLQQEPRNMTEKLCFCISLDVPSTFSPPSSIVLLFISLAFDLSPPPSKLSLFPSFLLFGCSFSHSRQG